MALTPFALSILGAEAVNRRGQDDGPDGEGVIPDLVPANSELRPAARTQRRPTCYYNSFQTACSPASDEPPSYNLAARQRPIQRTGNGADTLPKYTCTVAVEAKVLLYLETPSPLYLISGGEWKEVYAVLRGTLLSFHRAKDNGPGKLLRSYTLQHAEVGLAADTHHTVLVPQTRLAHLIPGAARRKAWSKDPDLFQPVRQNILRLRVETDQILLADASEEKIHSLIHSISAGIDISQAIDDRSVPRQCTVPRRRRRQRANYSGDLNDPALLAEQERIMSEMYPSFAGNTSGSQQDLAAPNTTPADELSGEPGQTGSRDDDEIDLAAIREDSAPSQRRQNAGQRPTTSRQTTSTSINSTYSDGMMYATSSANFDTSGKWDPPHQRTAQQVQRYIRRCMPVLLADSPRASDILISNGKRVKVNWRMQLLEEWELRPPSYKSHHFTHDLSLERAESLSHSSATGSTANLNGEASTSEMGSEDQITPVEMGLATLALAKITTMDGSEKPLPALPREASVIKTRGSQYSNSDAHAVVFCF